MKEKFELAAQKAQELTVRPSNEDLLKLYALYKQATEGDVQGNRPGGFDFKGAAKYDAWADMKGTPTESAMENYIALVEDLQARES